MNNSKNAAKKENPVEEVIKLAREEKINEEDLLRQSIEEKNKLIKEQEDKIKQLEEKNKESYRQILSLKAEFENYRTRVEKEKRKQFLLGKIYVLEELITLYETFLHAITSMKDIKPLTNKVATNETNNRVDNIVEGINLLYKQLENFLKKEGVEKIDCVGEMFDPLRHEIVEYEYNDDKEKENVIVAIVSNGYLIKHDGEEIVLRPAKVKVIKPHPEETKVDTEPTEQPDENETNVEKQN